MHLRAASSGRRLSCAFLGRSVKLCQTTRRHIPDDGNVHSRRHKSRNVTKEINEHEHSVAQLPSVLSSRRLRPFAPEGSESLEDRRIALTAVLLPNCSHEVMPLTDPVYCVPTKWTFCIFSKSYDTNLINPPPTIWQQIRALKCVSITICVYIAINVITEKRLTENNLSLEQSSLYVT